MLEIAPEPTRMILRLGLRRMTNYEANSAPCISIYNFSHRIDPGTWQPLR